MDDLPIARLLASALRLAVDEMHERLAAEGFDDLRSGARLRPERRRRGRSATASASRRPPRRHQAGGRQGRRTSSVALDYAAALARTTADARRRPLTPHDPGRAALQALGPDPGGDRAGRVGGAAGGRRLATTRACARVVLDDATAHGTQRLLRPPVRLARPTAHDRTLVRERTFDDTSGMDRAQGQLTLDDLGTPLADVTFCVIDLETTGGSPTAVRHHRDRRGQAPRRRVPRHLPDPREPRLRHPARDHRAHRHHPGDGHARPAHRAGAARRCSSSSARP